MLEALKYISLPKRVIENIKTESAEILDTNLKDNKRLLKRRQKELDQSCDQLESIETKWINNQIGFETYNRWHSQLIPKIGSLKADIEKLSEDENDVYLLLQNQLDRLSDMQYIYTIATTTQKQAFIRQGFDNRLYYQNGVYRTPYILPIFEHNLLILKEKRLMELDEKKWRDLKSRQVEASGENSNLRMEDLQAIEGFVVSRRR